MVFSRDELQSFFVGDAKVTILEIRGGHVRIGIDADKDIPVHREEIYVKVQAEGGRVKVETQKSGKELVEAGLERVRHTITKDELPDPQRKSC